jgi:hypothetical protein
VGDVGRPYGWRGVWVFESRACEKVSAPDFYLRT